MRRRLSGIVAVAAVMAAMAVPSTGHAATVNVFMSAFRFCNGPACTANQNTTIHAGDTVTWVFADPACLAIAALGCRHTATGTGWGSPQMPFATLGSSPVLTYSRTFSAAGTYSYVCVVHAASPFPLGPMAATIIVT